MTLTKLAGLIFDILTFFMIIFLLVLKDEFGKNVFESLIGNNIIRWSVYFLLIRQLYKLLDWKKKYFDS